MQVRVARFEGIDLAKVDEDAEQFKKMLRTDERPDWMPAAALDADQVALLLLDGLGWEQLQARRQQGVDCVRSSVSKKHLLIVRQWYTSFEHPTKQSIDEIEN